MFKVISNSKDVSFHIDRSVKRKIRNVEQEKDRFMKDIHRSMIWKVNNSRSPEKSDLAKNIILDLRKGEIYTSVWAYYAPFIEFGTKGKFRLPMNKAKLAGIASQFRNIPMNFNDLVERIEETTGHRREVAAAIVRVYGKQGSTARPFFYNSFFENLPTFKNRLKLALKK